MTSELDEAIARYDQKVASLVGKTTSSIRLLKPEETVDPDTVRPTHVMYATSVSGPVEKRPWLVRLRQFLTRRRSHESSITRNARL